MTHRKQWACLAASVLSCAVASAACHGSRSFQTCSDDPGRSEDVRRPGEGMPSRDGPSPAGTARSPPAPPSPGDARARQGAAADGGAGGGTSQNYGGTTYRQGIDNRGRFYNRTCTATGCF
jgi:hypothetical protein